MKRIGWELADRKAIFVLGVVAAAVIGALIGCWLGAREETFRRTTELSGALLTPLIAILAVYIAWRQSETDRRRLRMDLYDRRLNAYEQIEDVIGWIVSEGTASKDDIFLLARTRRDVLFLFGSAIEEYVGELQSKAAHLRKATTMLDSTSDISQEDREQLAEEESQLVSWFSEQQLESREIFADYMQL